MPKKSEEKLILEEKRYQGESSVVSARLPKNMVSEIDKIAKKMGYNRNEIISICMTYALDHLELKERK